jgi:hypothetical protein
MTNLLKASIFGLAMMAGAGIAAAQETIRFAVSRAARNGSVQGCL